MARAKLADVVVGAGLFAALVGVAGAAVGVQRETDRRVRCAKNLHQLGESLMVYANQNNSNYPRTIYERDKPPVWGTPYADDGSDAKPTDDADPFGKDSKASRRPAVNDVTAALWLLMRETSLEPTIFVCPGTRQKPFAFDRDKHDAASQFTNFAGKHGLAANLSYSYANPYPSTDAINNGYRLNNTLGADFAVMADLNPGSDALLALDANSPPDVLKKANSPNHGGLAQNILFGDGHVEIVNTPLTGVGRDNIYTANGPAPGRTNPKQVIVDSPADANDSVLLPTAKDLGLDAPLPAIVPAKDPAALAKKIAGHYARPDGSATNNTLALEVGDHAIRVTSEHGPFEFKVLGTRGDAVVVSLKDEKGKDAGEADFTFVGKRLYIDADGDSTAELVGFGGAGDGWERSPN